MDWRIVMNVVIALAVVAVVAGAVARVQEERWRRRAAAARVRERLKRERARLVAEAKAQRGLASVWEAAGRKVPEKLEWELALDEFDRAHPEIAAAAGR